MAHFVPAFLAFLLNVAGVVIFLENSKVGCEPLVSCLIFLFAVFLLIWEMKLYPRYLRRLHWVGRYLYDFLASAFLMEHIMNDFWFPLESSLNSLLPKIADLEEETLKAAGFESIGGSFQFLRSNITIVISSYLWSICFLLCVLHSTRIIDFRLLSKCGLATFVEDIRYRGKRSFRKLRRSLIRPKAVKFDDCNNTVHTYESAFRTDGLDDTDDCSDDFTVVRRRRRDFMY